MGFYNQFVIRKRMEMIRLNSYKVKRWIGFLISFGMVAGVMAAMLAPDLYTMPGPVMPPPPPIG